MMNYYPSWCTAKSVKDLWDAGCPPDEERTEEDCKYCKLKKKS